MPSKYEQKWNQVTYPFNLDEVLSDADFKSEPSRWNMMPGSKRWENALMGEGVYRNVFVDGHAKFIWACNRCGGTAPLGMPGSFYRKAITATDGSVNTFVCATDTFLDNEEVFNQLYILDDAGALGATPEGEFGRIIKNDGETLTIQTPETDQEFTEAVAVGDTGIIKSTCQFVPSYGYDPVGDFGGVVVRQAGIPDNYWGWWAVEADLVAALIRLATLVTEDLGLRIAGNADGSTIALSRFENTGTGNLALGRVLGMTKFTLAADAVKRLSPVMLRPSGLREV